MLGHDFEALSTEYDINYVWDYASREEGLRNLYEKSKAGHWNAKTDPD